jgi:hypothetical protein
MEGYVHIGAEFRGKIEEVSTHAATLSEFVRTEFYDTTVCWNWLRGDEGVQ